MSQSSSALRAAPSCSPDLPPLFASLCEEAKRHQVTIDLADRKLVEKINVLAKSVPREYEIVQVFRAFLEDPKRPSVFFFPDRYDRYDRLRKVPSLNAQVAPATEAPAEACPVCGSNAHLIGDAEEDLLSCNRCFTWLRRGPGGELFPTSVPQVDTSKLSLPWRRSA